ncbi:MAG: cell division protein ZapB [Deltaproteobacteria bacterium]|nr:cell division protein ZapB [Deltaproteobacteria bacterium]
MSTELLATLENRVMNAVGALEDLRSEIRGLKEERLVLENKLRELLMRMDQAERSAESSEAPAMLTDTLPERHSPSDNGGSSGSEY